MGGEGLAPAPRARGRADPGPRPSAWANGWSPAPRAALTTSRCADAGLTSSFSTLEPLRAAFPTSRRMPRFCPTCSYPLSGSDICPMCGTPAALTSACRVHPLAVAVGPTLLLAGALLAQTAIRGRCPPPFEGYTLLAAAALLPPLAAVLHRTRWTRILLMGWGFNLAIILVGVWIYYAKFGPA